MLRRSTIVLTEASSSRRTTILAGTSEPSRRFLALRSGSNTLPTRTIVSTSRIYRADTERLPAGHVRPRRRSPASPSSSISAAHSPTSEWQHPSSTEETTPVVSHRVHVPPDPNGVLNDNHAARNLLAHDTLVIVRQLEMMNVFLGYEQANRYAIYTTGGDLVGYLAEEEQGLLSVISRQALRTHRPFKATILDPAGKPILWIRRPFAFINSRIYVHAAEGKEGTLVGESQQEWHPWRRRYNIFQARSSETFSQFARIDSGLLSWDFWLKDQHNNLVASINRNFKGLGRELFTDTGQYVIRFDSAGMELEMPAGSEVNLQGQSLILQDRGEGGMTLDQRAMTLATAVSIDFDFFSRHSGSGGMGLPFFMWGTGDGSTEHNQSSVDNTGNIPAGPASGTAGTAAEAATIAGAAGASSAAQAGRGPSEDEQIYGPQGGQQQQQQQSDSQLSDSDGPASTEAERNWWEGDVGDEDVMEDPWSQGGDNDDGGGGFFGGGGSGDGDWF